MKAREKIETTDTEGPFLWSKPGVPRKGWFCEGVEDLGEPEHKCEMCGNPAVRYVHLLSHPDHESLKVGSVCASHMVVGYDAKGAEARCRTEAQRLENFLTKGWRVSAKGNLWRKKRGRRIVVGRNRMGWWSMIDGQFIDSGRNRREDAMRSVFELAGF